MIDKNSTKAEVMAAVEQHRWALAYASDELRNDREVVLAAVKQNGYALQYASEELRADLEIIMTAVMENCYALKYATSGELYKGVKCWVEYLED